MADSYGFAACFFCERIITVSKLEKVRVPPCFGGEKLRELARPKEGVEANACLDCADQIRSTHLLTSKAKRRK